MLGVLKGSEFWTLRIGGGVGVGNTEEGKAETHHLLGRPAQHSL